MPYVVTGSYVSWQGKRIDIHHEMPDARSTLRLLTGLGRDGVREYTIVDPNGSLKDQFDVIKAAKAEDDQQAVVEKARLQTEIL